MIYTFYSYKGGVGRTMALANVAELLRQAGANVLMVDWDLEAPGLNTYFPQRTKDTLGHKGVIDMLQDYKLRMTQPPRSETGKGTAEDSLPLPGIEQYLQEIYPGVRGKGRTWLIPAGRRAGRHFSRYANLVNTFDWQDFYQNWEGELFFEWLRQRFQELADIVLIDSRTGVTEMGGVCTYQLADVVVMFCSPNTQNIDGTYMMALNFKAQEVKELRSDRPLEILVVPTRVEDRAETIILNEFRQEFITKFGELVRSRRRRDVEPLWQMKVPHVPFYAFQERVAVRETGSARSDDLVHAYSFIVQEMVRFAPPEAAIRKVARRIKSLPTASSRPEVQKPTFARRSIFIIHRHEDSGIANALSRVLQIWGGGEIEIFLSSDSGRGLRVGQSVYSELRSKLSDANILILVYTFANRDWSWSMYECGLAMEPLPGTFSKRIIVLQCTQDAPKVFTDQERVRVTPDGIRQFTHQFYRDPSFFPGFSQAFSPDISDLKIEELSQDLFETLNEKIPTKLREEILRGDMIRISLHYDCVQEIIKKERRAAFEIASRIIPEKAIVRAAFGGVLMHFDYAYIAADTDTTLGSLIERWKEVTQGVYPSAWIDGLYEEMTRAIMHLVPVPTWYPMKSCSMDLWFVPKLNSVRFLPDDNSMEFDVYFYQIPVDTNGCVQIGFSQK